MKKIFNHFLIDFFKRDTLFNFMIDDSLNVSNCQPVILEIIVSRFLFFHSSDVFSSFQNFFFIGSGTPVTKPCYRISFANTYAWRYNFIVHYGIRIAGPNNFLASNQYACFASTSLYFCNSNFNFSKFYFSKMGQLLLEVLFYL